jgi:amino acid permease
MRQSIFTLVQTALGGGVLAISYVLRLSGLGLGLVLLAVCGVVAIVGMHVIMRSAVDLKIYTFSGLLAACMGKASGVFLDASLFLYGTGACIAYFIFLGDFIPAMLHILCGDVGFDEQELRSHCLLATLVVIVPLSLPKELSALRYVSPIALAGILYTTVIVVCKMPSLYLDHVSSSEAHIEFFKLDRNIFRCFSMCVFAYNCHINVVPVTQELVDASPSRINKITSRVAGVQFALYVLISCGGYLSFFDKTPGNLITAYADSDPWIFVSRVMLSITITAAIPTSLNPTVRSLLNLCEVCLPWLREDRLDQEGEGQPNKLKPLLSGVQEHMQEEAPPRAILNRECLRKLLCVLCCLGQCGVAIKVSNVATVIGILGASISTLMMMVIPILLMHIACPKLYSPMRKWSYTVLLSISAVMSLSTLVVA